MTTQRQQFKDELAELIGLVFCIVFVSLVCWAILVCGCTRTDQQRVLAVMTQATTAAIGSMVEAVQAEENACIALGTYEAAKACVDKSRAKWAPAWGAVDVLAAVDQAALDGEPDLAMALRVYCELASVYPKLPAPPIGGCNAR